VKLKPDQITVTVQPLLCEPDGGHAAGSLLAVCNGPREGDEQAKCSRVAFRAIGDNPWVNCVCGHRFNSNYAPQIELLPEPHLQLLLKKYE
jgi:hypothetical protein